MVYLPKSVSFYTFSNLEPILNCFVCRDTPPLGSGLVGPLTVSRGQNQAAARVAILLLYNVKNCRNLCVTKLQQISTIFHNHVGLSLLHPMY